MFCGLWGFNCSEISLPIATKGTWGHGQVEVEGANLHKGGGGGEREGGDVRRR